MATPVNEVVLQRILRLLALIGVIAILVLMVGFGASFLKNSMKSLASLFSAISLTREQITIEITPSMAFSGDPFTVRWTHEKKSEPGGYDFSYPCRPSLSMKLESGELILCNSAFPVSNRPSVVLIPDLKEGGSLDLPVTIAFTPEGADRPGLNATSIVIIAPRSGNASATTTTPAPKPGGQVTTPRPNPAPVFGPGATTTITVPIPPRINPSGVPDLKIEIVAIGVLQRSTTTAGAVDEVFVQKSSVAQGEKAAVVFDVKNIGTNVTGEWNFSAQLPVLSGNFNSGTQASINPESGVRYTLGFENLNNPGANTVTIMLDPEAKIWRDPNRLNNSVSITVYRGY